MTTIDTVRKTYAKWLGDNYDTDALDIVLAVAATERLGGDPPWLLIVGGSGAAKTETIVPLKAAGAHVTSTIQSEGALLSASHASKTAKATGGLLRAIGDRGTLVVKDFTSIISMHRDMRATVLAALREIHDGYWERNVGVSGGRTLTWAGRIVLVGATTTAYDAAHTVISAMGDRFLLVRLDSTENDNRMASGLQALDNTCQETGMRDELAGVVGQLMDSVDADSEYTLDQQTKIALVEAADLVTRARTAVERDYRGDPIDAHAPEMPTRFVKMLAQVVRGCLAIGLPLEEARDRALRVAHDSMPPLRLQVLADVAEYPMSLTSDVVRRVQKPRNTVDRALQELHILGVLVQQNVPGDLKWHYSVTRSDDITTVRDLVSRKVIRGEMGGRVRELSCPWWLTYLEPL